MNLEGKTEEDYQEAIREFCKDNPNLTIYLAGEISHPGISDLDFVVVDEFPVISPKVEKFLMGGKTLSPAFRSGTISTTIMLSPTRQPITWKNW